MNKTVEDIIGSVPAESTIIGWGEVRLMPTLFRDMVIWCTKHTEAVKFQFAVDIETANYINTDELCPIVVSENYRAAPQDGSRIGAYDGQDMHVLGFDNGKHYLVMMCLDDDDKVVYVATSLLKDIEAQKNILPKVTPYNVKALSGNFED